MSRKEVTDVFNFLGGGIIPATPVSNGPWVSKITGTGPPTVAPVAGSAQLALEATSQVQNACLYFNDDLPYDVDDLKRVRFWVHTPVAIASASKVRFGLTSARNDDPDAIAQSILFGLDGNANLNVESDDTADEVAATSTGEVLGTALKICTFDFAAGVFAQAPPLLSKGGKHNIYASVQDVNGASRRVADGVRLTLGAYTGNLQLFAQIQKTAATDVGTLGVRRIEVVRYE
jgi:hypothetical protein